jgi:hypothetical protein
MKQSRGNNAKGFFSEHSAEYVLVPILKNILHEEYNFVTPIYPSLSKEGSNLARKIHKDEKFKVVGLYPRRPKLVFPDDSITTIKLNHEILRAAEHGEKIGVPMIAGCPLVKNFWELGKNPECCWIKLGKGIKDDTEIKIEKNQDVKNKIEESCCLFVNKEELLAYYLEHSLFMRLEDAIMAFREIKYAYWGNQYRGYFGIMSGYKPVYFLMK